MTKRIDQLFELPALRPYTSGRAVPLYNPAPALLYGAELEIENTEEGWATTGLREEADGSLRNNGREYISDPMTYSNLAYVIRNFFDRHAITANNYSERCSVHLHTNVRDLTMKQVATICMVYQVVENVLFNWVGLDRRKNIFCVPWNETLMNFNAVYRITAEDQYVFGDWEKYTALNINPVRRLGTIEWRHLEGTNDVERILTWARLIGHIYRYSLTNDMDKIKEHLIGLNTSSLYNNLLSDIFQDDSVALRTPGFESCLEDGVLAMKYSLLERTPKKKDAPAYLFNPVNNHDLLRELEDDGRRRQFQEEVRLRIREIQEQQLRFVVDDLGPVNNEVNVQPDNEEVEF